MSLIFPKTCNMGSSKTGLVGTIGVTLFNADGTTHTARTTSGIYEFGGGCYGKEFTFPDNWKGSVFWDTGDGSPVYAVEEYEIGGAVAAIWDDEDAESILYGGEVVFCGVHGSSGTAKPIGTYSKPSNNLTDSLAIAIPRHIKRIMLGSDLTIEASHNVNDFAMETYGGAVGVNVTLEEGCSADDTIFRYLNLSGIITNGDRVFINICSISELYNFTGFMEVVSFAQGAELTIGLWANLLDCHAGGEPGNEPEITIGDGLVIFNKWTGNLKLKGKTGSDNTVVNMLSGNIIIDSTCVAGRIQIIGSGQLERDDSGPGCQVDTDALISTANIADAVWDELKSGHETADSFGETASKILGLSQENIGMDQHVYIPYKDMHLLTSARIRIYSNAVSAAALADIDVIATYLAEATWDGNKLLTYTVVQQ
jgi:hypothetical protein